MFLKLQNSPLNQNAKGQEIEKQYTTNNVIVKSGNVSVRMGRKHLTYLIQVIS